MYGGAKKKGESQRLNQTGYIAKMCRYIRQKDRKLQSRGGGIGA
jgi:hypothetical protein